MSHGSCDIHVTSFKVDFNSMNGQVYNTHKVYFHEYRLPTVPRVRKFSRSFECISVQ